jgi:hypothetical protein
LQITDHKTATSGPVALGMSPHLFLLLKQLSILSSRLPGGIQDDYIFRTFPHGRFPSRCLTSSQSNYGIQSIWGGGLLKAYYCGSPAEGDLDTVEGCQSGHQGSLGCPYDTPAGTADKYYKLHRLRESALEITTAIADTMEVSI